MAIKNRTDLKAYFVKNAIPTEGNFGDLIDSQLIQSQDGVFKPDGEPLSVVAAPGDQKRVLRLYANYPPTNADWMISLNPAQDPAGTGTGRPGFGITDGAGNTRLFVEAGTGRIGVGTNIPQFALDVVGGVQANGFRGRYDLVLVTYQTANPASNVCLHSPPGDRDTWIYRDTADSTSNWGIYHRQINSPVAGLPGNSIGFVGGGSSKLQAYVNLGDGSGFFAGSLSVQGGLNVHGYGILTNPKGEYNSHFPYSDDNAYVTGRNVYLRGGESPSNKTILTVMSGGSVGINTTTPDAALDVMAHTTTWGGWYEAIRFSHPSHSAITLPSGKLQFGMHSDRNFYFSDTEGGHHVMTISAETGNVNIGVGLLGVAGGVKANEIGLGTTLHGATSNPYETIQMNPGHNLRIWYGTTERFRFMNNGIAQAHGSWQNAAFDLAERFQNHEDGLEPGDVLAVDPRSPERLVKSRSAQQDDLVGVVSERPGFILGVQWEDPDTGISLALAGRVPVKVNLEGGPIRIGDYLTSSSQPGVAMRTIQSGRVIGMAMQAFDGAAGGEGKVVVFVNPHWFGGR